VNTRDAKSPRLAVLEADGCGLRVLFSWQEDRYGHDIAFLAGRTETVLLTCQLGRRRDPWPDSPPLQQASTQQLADGSTVVLAMGMAGKGHWSASIEADPRSSSLVFDVACRTQLPPRWLGGTYLASSPVRRIDERTVELEVGERRVSVRTEPAADWPAPVVKADGKRVAIVAPLDAARPPATFRWKYRVRFE
jgi:hypothetical protein